MRRSSKPKPVPVLPQPLLTSASESPAVAERLAEYQRDSPVPLSPETDSGSESLKLSCQLSSTSTTMPEASNTPETTLTSSFKDKMKIEKSRSVAGGANQNVRHAQELDQKKVTVRSETGTRAPARAAGGECPPRTQTSAAPSLPAGKRAHRGWISAS